MYPNSVTVNIKPSNLLDGIMIKSIHLKYFLKIKKIVISHFKFSNHFPDHCYTQIVPSIIIKNLLRK